MGRGAVMRARLRSLSTFSVLLVASAASAEVGLTDLGPLNGGVVNGISADASAVVGTSGHPLSSQPSRAFLWKPDGGMLVLGTLNSGPFSFGNAINADGTVVVGSSADGAAGNQSRAFRWTQASGMVSLGSRGGVGSAAFGVNADGTVVVGSFSDPTAGNTMRAFRWTQTTGMVSLGSLGGEFSIASGVNADGSVVVGTAGDPTATQSASRAFRWTQATGMVSLGTLNGAVHSSAAAVNADGSVIVGRSGGTAGNTERAFRWTQATGMVSLGTLNAGASSLANAVNASGSVVVGQATDGLSAEAWRAYRWTQATGMQSVETWLRTNGVDVARGVNTASATGVDALGSVVVGTLDNGHGFIARVSPLGSGMITSDFALSLSSAQPQRTSLDAGSLVLHGSHGNPLLGRVRPGQSCVWASGDWGHAGHGDSDGSLGLAEFGACRALSGGTQLTGSLGLTRSRQDLTFAGDSKLTGWFGSVEVTKQLGPSSFWGTLTSIYHRGDVDVRRGYINAGLIDASVGSTDTKTWGVRARIDWDASFRADSFTFSPYADVSYIRARADAYSESGGGFPVRFDERTDSASEARIGLNGLLPIGKGRFLTTLEAVHRFDQEGSRNSGQLLGLFRFDIPGVKYERDWLRAGLGFDGKIGAGTASIMLNATTKGEAPTYWLATSYRLAF